RAAVAVVEHRVGLRGDVRWIAHERCRAVVGLSAAGSRAAPEGGRRRAQHSSRGSHLSAVTAIENARARSHRASAALGVPGFAVVALGGSGDGIAYSARLADAVLRELSGDARRVIELAPRAATGVSIGERFRFTAKLIAADTRRRVDWWLFNHLSVARAYRLVPTPLRRPYGIILHGIEVWDSALSSDRRAALRGARVRIAVSAHTASKVRATHPD